MIEAYKNMAWVGDFSLLLYLILEKFNMKNANY